MAAHNSSMALQRRACAALYGSQARRRRLLHVLALTALSVAPLLPHARGASLSFQPSFTAVNWSLVSSDAISAAQATLIAPIGCTCVSDSGASDCSFFECKCECDLTAGACDPFCCCDEECTIEQLAATRVQGLCNADSATTAPSIEYCATDLTLGKKNGAVNALVAESVLCVALDNNEVVGEYFAAAPEEQMTVASAFLKNPKVYSFANSITEEQSSTDLLAVAASVTPASKTAYAPGDAIRIFTSPSANQSVIHLPVLSGFGAAIGSNECWELNIIRFEFAQEPITCVRKAVQLESLCADTAGFLSVAPFVHLVAKWPNVTSSSSGSQTELLTVEIEIKEFDYTTGALTAIQKPYPSYIFSPELLKDTSNMGVVCRGALLRLDYVVFHDSQGHLERIAAHGTIGNLTSTTATANGNATLTAPVDVAQTFSVSFQSQAALSSDVISLANGNLQTYQRSGNPGYLLHFPVRVGILTTNSESTASTKGIHVISEMAGGLQVPGLGDCLGKSSALTPQTISFGEDSQTSCSLALSATQFEALCTSSEALLPSLKVNFTHVATFGNSDPFLSSSEWLVLDYDPPVKSSTRFSDATEPGNIELSCSDLITGVHFEFLIAGVGAARSPQHKIVAARATHSKEMWRFWKSGQATKKQSFLLHTTVSFVFVKPRELEQLIPPAPPIWFSIPNDVFYPFILNDAPSVGSRPPWGIVGLLWLVIVLHLV